MFPVDNDLKIYFPLFFFIHDKKRKKQTNKPYYPLTLIKNRIEITLIHVFIVASQTFSRQRIIYINDD